MHFLFIHVHKKKYSHFLWKWKITKPWVRWDKWINLTTKQEFLICFKCLILSLWPFWDFLASLSAVEIFHHYFVYFTHLSSYYMLIKNNFLAAVAWRTGSPIIIAKSDRLFYKPIVLVFTYMRRSVLTNWNRQSHD